MTRPTTTGKAQDLITFTRSTTGTALAKISYGEELVTNGDFSTDSDWAGANWSIIDESLNHAGTSFDVVFPSPSAGFVSGKLYTITLTKTGAGSIYFYYDGSPNFLNFIGVGTFTQTFIAGSNSSFFIGTSGDNYKIDNISIKEVLYDQPDGTLQLFNHPINKPRIEYDASGNCLGLLVEEARTNALLQSGNIGAWSGSVGSKTNVTLTENAITAPDGTQTADKVQRTVLDAAAAYSQTKSVVAGNDYTFSIFAKADVQAKLELDFSNSRFTSNDYVRFDVDTGTAYGSGAGATYSITNYGNGWYRFSLTATCTTSGSTNVLARIINNEAHYAWGGQFEQGSFPTSYIPTSGSVVTRAADVASLAVSEFGYNQDQGTVVAFQETFGTTGNLVPWEIHTANTNRIVYNAKSSTATIITGGSVQASLNHADQLPSVFYKQGLAFKKDDIASSLDASILTDTSGTIPTVSSFKIGTDYSLLAMLNGHIKSIQYYPLRLSNAQLQALTL